MQMIQEEIVLLSANIMTYLFTLLNITPTLLFDANIELMPIKIDAYIEATPPTRPDPTRTCCSRQKPIFINDPLGYIIWKTNHVIYNCFKRYLT